MSKKAELLHCKADTVFREEENGAFLFDPDTGRVCYLNDLGKEIWRQCAQSCAPEQIIETICKQYPGEPAEKIAADCGVFFNELKRLAFVTEDPAL